MNFNRIISLIRFDWAIIKNKFVLILSLATIITLCVVLVYASSKSIYNFRIEPETPYLLATMISACFEYAQLAMVFLVTTLLHQKFTNPRSATSYLSMPGTSAEKYFAMLSEYALAALMTFVVYLFFHSVTMLVGWFYAPEFDWAINPFSFVIPVSNINDLTMTMQGHSWDSTMSQLAEMAENENIAPGVLSAFISSINAILWFSPVITLCQFFAYICVNMLFRTNGQLKTIAIFVSCSIVFTIVLIIACVGIFGHEIATLSADNSVSEVEITNIIMTYLTRFFDGLKYLCYSTPLIMIGLAYLFYYQICRKQAK